MPPDEASGASHRNVGPQVRGGELETRGAAGTHASSFGQVGRIVAGIKQILPKRCKQLEPTPMETEDGNVKHLHVRVTKAQVLARPQLSHSKSLKVDLDVEGLCQHKRLIR